MNWRAIQAIVLKDLKVVTRSRAVMLPLVIVPLVFFVVFPGAVLFISKAPPDTLAQLNTSLKQMSGGLQQEMAGLSSLQQMVELILVYFFAPMYLILPLMVASVIAADSFAGEKERQTLEALLYTPTTDKELLVAKLLSAWLPAVGVALGGFVVYSIAANLVGAPVMGGIFFPNVMWFVVALWVAPAAAGLGLGAMVLVSARVRSFQEAYQLGSMVVLPVVLLAIGQAAGVMYFSVGLVIALGLVLWLLDGVIIWLGTRLFKRTQLAKSI